MSTGSGGQSSSRGTVDTFQGNGDDDDEEEDEPSYDELSHSQLQDAPSTQHTQVAGTRRRRPPCKYTPGTGGLGYKGKGKTRRR
jgi:hypothetical protein